MSRLFSISVLLIVSSALHAQALPSIQFATAEQVILPLEYELDGVVEATNQATLASEVMGRIEQIYFDVGDSVNKDDINFKIRDTEYRARQQIALASLKDSEARLREAKLEFKRIKDLFNKNLISASGFEKALGIGFQVAVIQAAVVRAKPIVLTGLAAIMGALFILDDPIFNGLAIALIFGILISTLLTLLVIPVMFYTFNYQCLEENTRAESE